ncbi:MAG: sodium/solute symporter, partial [Rhodobacterales bacterium]|nr:sodium/solute symporter [Rhodobacterales bacterium]
MDPYLYQYAIGGLVFAVGMMFAWRQGYVGGGARAPWTLVLVGGLALIAGIQGFLEYAPMSELPAVPYTGEPLRPGRLGQPIDYAVMVGYFVAILGIGVWFGQGQKNTKDFFFGGQRFSWWLIAASLVATTIGSASFVKYSKIAWGYGLASSQTYLNDWFWLPLVIFGWLPILYFSRLTSIPEYFEHRFGAAQRRIITALLLLYLVGYVGINLFTMGKALNTLLGWPVFGSAVLVAGISAIYVSAGGQASVIMTDLFQGVMLLATGMLLLVLGAHELGGLEPLWENMPRGHRTAFTNFNEDPSYNSVGIFWQDGMANSAMFYFLNQGILMRFMAARSVDDGRKAAVTVLAVLMPIAAVVVASGGWVGRALAHAGVMPPDMPGDAVFFVTAELLARPGVFGLIMASLTAALMSTVDSLITAIAAIVVNDVVRPMRPKATDPELLNAARVSSIVVAMVGVGLVPVFMEFDSIYAA